MVELLDLVRVILLKAYAKQLVYLTSQKLASLTDFDLTANFLETLRLSNRIQGTFRQVEQQLCVFTEIF